MSFSKRDDNPLTGKNPTITSLVDYEKYCGFKIQGDNSKGSNEEGRNEAGSNHAGRKEAGSYTAVLKEITVQQLKQLIDSGADFQIIDVREPHEYEIVNLNGELIPLAQIADNASRIDRSKQVIIHCKSGSRSAKAIKVLEEKFGFTNLYNLEGGIIKYVEEIETGWMKY